MTKHSVAALVIMDTLGGRLAGPQCLNEDLAWHAQQGTQAQGPGRLARMAAFVSKLLAPRSVILGTQGMSAHMMRDMGLDRPLDAPGKAASQGGGTLRPVALGGRLAVNF